MKYDKVDNQSIDQEYSEIVSPKESSISPKIMC